MENLLLRFHIKTIIQTSRLLFFDICYRSSLTQSYIPLFAPSDKSVDHLFLSLKNKSTTSIWDTWAPDRNAVEHFSITSLYLNIDFCSISIVRWRHCTNQPPKSTSLFEKLVKDISKFSDRVHGHQDNCSHLEKDRAYLVQYAGSIIASIDISLDQDTSAYDLIIINFCC